MATVPRIDPHRGDDGEAVRPADRDVAMAPLRTRLADRGDGLLPEVAELTLSETDRVGADEPDDPLVFRRQVRDQILQADPAAGELAGESILAGLVGCGDGLHLDLGVVHEATKLLVELGDQLLRHRPNDGAVEPDPRVGNVEDLGERYPRPVRTADEAGAAGGARSISG